MLQLPNDVRHDTNVDQILQAMSIAKHAQMRKMQSSIATYKDRTDRVGTNWCRFNQASSTIKK